MATKKQDEGLKTLVPKGDMISIEEIKLQDFFAAFALLGVSRDATPQRIASDAWDIAEEMVKERKRRY